MKILSIPIEPLEERYSVQWDNWFMYQFREHSVDVKTIYGDKTSGKINSGSFLDVIETNQYKNSQLQKILEYLKTYDDKETLVLFFHDLWNPALTSIAYIRDGLGLKNLRICGCLHAGSYDPFDFLNKREMTHWAKYIEAGWFRGIVDKIFVATNYHKELVVKERLGLMDKKVVVTGFPIYNDFKQPVGKIDDGRGPIIVFPHRLDSEKNPQLFDRLRHELQLKHPEWLFIKTKEFAKSKEGYYRILQSADVAVSFADQETWGIAMQEAVICGCTPIVPNRLSYKEMYHNNFLYNCFEECVKKIEQEILKPSVVELMQQKATILENGRNAIPNMIKEMQKL